MGPVEYRNSVIRTVLLFHLRFSSAAAFAFAVYGNRCFFFHIVTEDPSNLRPDGTD
jgi:hypothetical protein